MFSRLLFAILIALSLFSGQAMACTNPVGVAGDMTYNDSEHVMQWCDGTNWNGVNKSPYIPNAVYFDHANDYLQLPGAFTGVTDSQSATFSFWFKRNMEFAGSTDRPFMIGIDDFEMVFYISNEFRIQGRDSGNTPVLILDSGTAISDSEWHHIMVSFDLSNTSNRHIYLDGTALATATWGTYNTAGVIDFDQAGTKSIGVDTANTSNKFPGSLADFWMDMGTYIDLSVAANRAQFIDANGWPVDLGTDGSKATGAVPDIFLSGDTATWHTNKGTGGGFTENGALTDALSAPGANLGPTSGLIGWWKMDETSGTTVTDSSGNGNNGSLIDSATFASNIRGTIGGAAQLPGYISTPSNRSVGQISLPSGLLDFNSDHTVSGWVKFIGPISSYARILTGSEGNSRLLLFRSNGFHYSSGVLGTDIVSQSSPTKPIGEWYHFALSYDGTTREHRLYVDGILEDTGSGAGMENYSSFMHLVSWSFNGVAGLIDDLRLYDRILNAAEITELYNTGFPCQNPTGQRDGDTMYNMTHHVPQYCNNREWKSMAPSPGDGNSCQTIGDTCSDGTVYAGLSPDGNVNMYVAANDSGSANWNDGNSNYTTTGLTSFTDGDGNTASLVTIDSNSAAAGVQTHNAAQTCYDLVAHTHNDWYLPARSELSVIYDNLVDQDGDNTPGGPLGSTYNFNTSGVFYLTSSEATLNLARYTRFSDGVAFGTVNKQSSQRIRCARKGSAPNDCSNPTGAEGDTFYNSTHNVMTYCEGDTWRAMGSYGP